MLLFNVIVVCTTCPFPFSLFSLSLLLFFIVFSCLSSQLFMHSCAFSFCVGQVLHSNNRCFSFSSFAFMHPIVTSTFRCQDLVDVSQHTPTKGTCCLSISTDSGSRPYEQWNQIPMAHWNSPFVSTFHFCVTGSQSLRYHHGSRWSR